MASDRRSAHLDPIAHERLAELRQELKNQGVAGDLRNPTILSALVMYITAPQLAGMLSEYARYTAQLAREAEGAQAEGDEEGA